MSDFFRSQMGYRFFESTMPALVRELGRLSDNLERLAKLLARSTADRPSAPTSEEPR